MKKDQILSRFSTDPDRYYKVSLFDKEGFQRKSCLKCRKFFWTLGSEQNFCPEDAETNYSFIGNPPTKKRFDFVQSWHEVENFFVENGHKSVGRYPVVCRWRDDLFFTIASIVDFQRVMGSKVIFEFPANPLIVPQVCLRFKDIENVGVTGRHFSSFCMIGQHSIPNSEGYWKDRCIDLDYRLLTERFGIDKQEIVFVEDVWAGGGSFGSSLEYFVRGLELGNAVFTEFQGDLENYSILDQKIIDMGAGLERFSWITMGTPTAYDSCFGPIINHLIQKIGVDIDSSILSPYFTSISKGLAGGNLNKDRENTIKKTGITDSQFNRLIIPLEGIYLIADHLRTLVFAISDGALPSNVGGGYNLRMILRRTISLMDRLGWKLDLRELTDMHIDYLKSIYPELQETREEVKTIIGIERDRYTDSKVRMKELVSSLKTQDKTLTVDNLIKLYESDGITPDFLKEMKIIDEVPPTFYEKLSGLHQSENLVEKVVLKIDNLPDTIPLYYKEDPMEFEAKVIKVINENFVVLDKTSFYPRGGGQEPDHGILGEGEVVDVNKHGNVIVHEVKGIIPKEGQIVQCKVDQFRRYGVTRNHTSTHVLNASARNSLGSWIWQHSAFKERDYGRLDITHHSNLTDEDIVRIEGLANLTIRKNLPVTINEYERGEAEQKFGFRIYQGGVVPVKSVRIVNIEGFDVEACGGTHVKKTGELGLIKIIKSERIQDGVVRMEFVSGDTAIKFTQEQDRKISQIVKTLGSSREKIMESFDRAISDGDAAKRKMKQLVKRVSKSIALSVISNAKKLENIKLYTIIDEELDEEFHIAVGEQAIKLDPTLIYCALIIKNGGVKLALFSGTEAARTKKAGNLAMAISKILGGSGGGNDIFGQGGGKNSSMIKDALTLLEQLIVER